MKTLVKVALLTGALFIFCLGHAWAGCKDLVGTTWKGTTQNGTAVILQIQNANQGFTNSLFLITGSLDNLVLLEQSYCAEQEGKIHKVIAKATNNILRIKQFSSQGEATGSGKINGKIVSEFTLFRQ